MICNYILIHFWDQLKIKYEYLLKTVLKWMSLNHLNSQMPFRELTAVTSATCRACKRGHERVCSSQLRVGAIIALLSCFLIMGQSEYHIFVKNSCASCSWKKLGLIFWRKKCHNRVALLCDGCASEMPNGGRMPWIVVLNLKMYQN